MGIVGPLRRLFYSSRVGDEDVAPLSFVAASVNILGGAAIPSMMLVRRRTMRFRPRSSSNLAIHVALPCIWDASNRFVLCLRAAASMQPQTCCRGRAFIKQ